MNQISDPILFGIGFKEILFIFLGYILLRFVLNIRKARKAMRSMRDQMEEQMREAQRAADPRQEGDIRIDKDVPRKKPTLDDGDYIDFEEVD